jgi:hypothetical protein
LEAWCIPTLHEEGIGIVTRWQKDATSSDALRAQTMGQLLCGLLATLVLIHVEGDIDS